MTLAVVRAEQRFSATELSTEVVDGRALPLHTHYSCPTCGQGVRFNRSDLEAAASSTNLEQQDAERMQREAAGLDVDPQRFLDWYCTGCGGARRVYCKAWAGGRHGDHGVQLGWVLEARAASNGAP